MIPRYIILNVLLITIATAAAQDTEIPVFTYCPKCIKKDDLTTQEVRVQWQSPTATDNSGSIPAVTCNRAPGDLFPVPSSTEIHCRAEDPAGNVATCSFRVILKKKSCPVYPPPKNGALACNSYGTDRICAAMCRNPSDFVFNPPLMYYCSAGEWQFFAPPTIPYQTTLPWPDCSGTVNPASFLRNSPQIPGYFFDGDANDPNVQNTIRGNFITLATGPFIIPFFCKDKPADCNANTVEVYAGTFKDEEPPVFTYCPNDITIDDATDIRIRVNWQTPTATDNSGKKPAIHCNIASGDIFAVPSSTGIQCTAEDPEGNRAICRFRVTVKKKSCPLYPPPKNGALACVTIGGDRSCAAMCRDPSDFVFNPPLLYYCSGGAWRFFGYPALPYQTTLPWPDCSDTANESVLKQSSSSFPGYFFDANDPNVDVQTTIKANYITLATGPAIPPLFCKARPADCNPGKVEVYLGAV